MTEKRIATVTNIIITSSIGIVIYWLLSFVPAFNRPLNPPIQTNVFEVEIPSKSVYQIKKNGLSVIWVNESGSSRFMLPIGTNSFELGMRSDGVVVWRTNK